MLDVSMSSCTFPSYASRSSTGQFLVFGQSSARAFAVYVISMAVVCYLFTNIDSTARTFLAFALTILH